MVISHRLVSAEREYLLGSRKSITVVGWAGQLVMYSLAVGKAQEDLLGETACGLAARVLSCLHRLLPAPAVTLERITTSSIHPSPIGTLLSF